MRHYTNTLKAVKQRLPKIQAYHKLKLDFTLKYKDVYNFPERAVKRQLAEYKRLENAIKCIEALHTR